MVDSMFALPTRSGYVVEWDTGKTRPKRSRRTHEVIGEVKITDSFYTRSKEVAEKKMKELKDAGFEGVAIHDCCY